MREKGQGLIGQIGRKFNSRSSAGPARYRKADWGRRHRHEEVCRHLWYPQTYGLVGQPFAAKPLHYLA